MNEINANTGLNIPISHPFNEEGKISVWECDVRIGKEE